MIPVPPDSSFAFDILNEYCSSNGLFEELVIGLCVLLLKFTRECPKLKLAKPVMFQEYHTLSRHRDAKSENLYRSLNSCMQLSSTFDALESLLCSVFFKPSVPCNLVGAADIGIEEAISPEKDNYQKFIQAIYVKAPQLAVLWKATMYNGQAKPLISMVLKSFPPICLAAALWTKTIQSFLQLNYFEEEAGKVTRANEFRVSFFCHPEPSIPWSPAPPFGVTTLGNLSLDLRNHFSHGHKPLRWNIQWKSCSEKTKKVSQEIEVDITNKLSSIFKVQAENASDTSITE